MNLYFWLFVLLAALGTVLEIHLVLHIGNSFRYRIRLKLAGVPVLQKAQEGAGDEKRVSAKTVRGMFAMDRRVLWALWRGGHVKKALKVIRFERCTLQARFSFPDAALTAMSCAALHTLVRTLSCCMAPASFPLSGQVEMNYRGEGTVIRIRCIFSARLGMLLAAALYLALAVIWTRAGIMKAEEEKYAAASH